MMLEISKSNSAVKTADSGKTSLGVPLFLTMLALLIILEADKMTAFEKNVHGTSAQIVNNGYGIPSLTKLPTPLRKMNKTI